MKADELQQHLDAAGEAAYSYEPELGLRARVLLIQQGNLAADNFLKQVEELGDGLWAFPYQDEIFNIDEMDSVAQESFNRVREKAIKAYVRHLPQTVHKPELELAAAGRKRQSSPGEVRINWDITSPFIAPAFERTGEQIASITQTTRGKVMGVIQSGYESGASIEEVAKEIRDTVRASSAGRAQTIARTEMVRLVNGTQLAATKVVSDAAEIIYYKRWLTAPGAEHPRHEDYEGLDGQTVSLDALFDVGGEQLDFPGDPDGTPDETCNCRCSMEMVESARSVAAAALPSDETTILEDTVETEELADQPNSGQCANCDHAASSHAGEMNDGECSVADCMCEGFEAGPTPGDSENPEASHAPVEQQVFLLGPASASSANALPYFQLTPVTTNAASSPYYSGTFDVQLPTEHQPAEELPVENSSPEAPSEEIASSAAFAHWTAIFAPEGKATDDGRIFALGSIGWRDLPLSLMAMTETPGEGGHAGAELCGRIDNIYRDDSASPTLIRADGVFNDDEQGQKIAQLVGDGFLTGNSVDLAVNGSKVVLKDAVVDDEGFWREGIVIDDVAEVEILDVMMGLIAFDEILFVITEAKIGMSTVCPFPAFSEATISLASDGSTRRWTTFQGVLPALQTVHMADAIRLVHAGETITASAAGLAPVVPPPAWFTNPQLEKMTPLTVTDDGKVYGHAWAWGECHIGVQDACTVAPHSNTGYAYFLLKEVETDDGACVECGTITLDTNHAARHLSWRDAASHYDHTGTAIADVTFGEDEHGGWFSGALRPDASAEAVRKFRGASVSGDWRRIHGNLELVGLLTVNVPGFPIPRTKALVAAADDGTQEVLTLIAAGATPLPASEISQASQAELALLAEQARGGLDELVSLAERARA